MHLVSSLWVTNTWLSIKECPSPKSGTSRLDIPHFAIGHFGILCEWGVLL